MFRSIEALNYYFGISTLEAHGLAHKWIQIGNKNGIPQQTGFTQNKVKEIDSNSREVLKKECEKVDMIMMIGSGMDEGAIEYMASFAKKSVQGNDFKTGGALGAVIIDTKPSQLDGLATLKINSSPNMNDQNKSPNNKIFKHYFTLSFSIYQMISIISILIVTSETI